MKLSRKQLENIGARLGYKYEVRELALIFAGALSEHNWHPAARVVLWMLEDWRRTEEFDRQTAIPRG